MALDQRMIIVEMMKCVICHHFVVTAAVSDDILCRFHALSPCHCIIEILCYTLCPSTGIFTWPILVLFGASAMASEGDRTSSCGRHAWKKNALFIFLIPFYICIYICKHIVCAKCCTSRKVECEFTLCTQNII